MTLSEGSWEHTRRAPNIDTELRLRAKKLTAPFQERIGPWQHELARLRSTQMFRAEEDVRAQAAELLPLVIAARIELEAVLSDADDEAVANHNLVLSVRASLERLRSELDALSEDER